MIINKTSHFNYSIFISVRSSSLSIVKRFYPGGKPPKLPISKEMPKLPPQQPLQSPKPVHSTSQSPQQNQQTPRRAIPEYTYPKDQEKAAQKTIREAYEHKNYTQPLHHEMPVKKTFEDISDDTKKTDNIYTAGILHVKEDTIILLPHQSHAVIVKENPNDTSFEAIAYLTSNSGTKIGLNGLAGAANTKLSDTKFNGSTQAQYAVPLIPPLIIQEENFKELPEIKKYLEDPNIVVTLDEINSQTSQYVPKPYKTEGLTEEKLKDLNDLDDLIEKNQPQQQNKDLIESSAKINETNTDDNDEHAKLAETLD